MTTMMLLAVTLSRAPRINSHVISITMLNAGRCTRIGMPAIRGAVFKQAVDLRIRAEQRRAIAGRQPDRQPGPEAAQQRVEVVAPRNGDGDVADGVLEDQVPADDPRDQLPHRRVRIGVGAARLRNHRGELGVAEPGQRARAAEQQERKDQRRAGAVPNHLAVGPDLSGRRRADGAENAGADHGADREHDQIAGAERALERDNALALHLREVRDGFPLKELRHERGIVLRGPVKRTG